MGRHSASDDDDLLEQGVDDAPGDSGLALLDELDDEPRGRHAWHGAPTAVLDRLSPAADVAVTDTAPVAVVDAPLAEPPPAPPLPGPVPPGATAIDASAAPETAPTRAPAGTKADLALLRTNSGLRARAAAAVVVPILIYIVVLAAIGHLDVVLYWVWIPIIVAGVLFGLMLDLADRRSKPDGSAALDEADTAAEAASPPPDVPPSAPIE